MIGYKKNQILCLVPPCSNLMLKTLEGYWFDSLGFDFTSGLWI